MAVAAALQPPLDGLDIDRQWVQVAVLDWTGHLATGLVLVALLRPRALTALGIMAGSVLIDLDHVPHALGTDALTHGTPRPYSHSLLTIVVLAALTLLARTRRRHDIAAVGAGLAIGVAGHLARDVGTGPGVSLLWPASDTIANVRFDVYLAVLGALAVLAAWRARSGTAHR